VEANEARGRFDGGMGMKPADTKRIYEQACCAKRIKPQDEEGRTWHRVLREFEARDVEAALDAWWADITPGHDNQPRGKWLPTPAELKPLVKRAEIKRISAQRESMDMIAWECAGPDKHRSTGFYPRSQPTPGGKKCCCGAELRFCMRCAA